ncbi:hypothetical protein C8F04DRAFT_1232588 [Mycena alexandri]|uniref:Uncharacterized protein n=1 Tax=Mycena alexandri TaxID=1745969 RepID=A0AAD6X3C6_9AGAR|nr:hypothetical protein C8F04DRAFT_1232588 [Mycena alexandri]
MSFCSFVLFTLKFLRLIKQLWSALWTKSCKATAAFTNGVLRGTLNPSHKVQQRPSSDSIKFHNSEKRWKASDAEEDPPNPSKEKKTADSALTVAGRDLEAKFQEGLDVWTNIELYGNSAKRWRLNCYACLYKMQEGTVREVQTEVHLKFLQDGAADGRMAKRRGQGFEQAVFAVGSGARDK